MFEMTCTRLDVNDCTCPLTSSGTTCLLPHCTGPCGMEVLLKIGEYDCDFKFSVLFICTLNWYHGLYEYLHVALNLVRLPI